MEPHSGIENCISVLSCFAISLKRATDILSSTVEEWLFASKSLEAILAISWFCPSLTEEGSTMVKTEVKSSVETRKYLKVLPPIVGNGSPVRGFLPCTPPERRRIKFPRLVLMHSFLTLNSAKLVTKESNSLFNSLVITFKVALDYISFQESIQIQSKRFIGPKVDIVSGTRLRNWCSPKASKGSDVSLTHPTS